MLLKAGKGRKKEKKKSSLFHQGHRTSATEPLLKEQDGNSKMGGVEATVRGRATYGWIAAAFPEERQQ